MSDQRFASRAKALVLISFFALAGFTAPATFPPEHFKLIRSDTPGNIVQIENLISTVVGSKLPTPQSGKLVLYSSQDVKGQVPEPVFSTEETLLPQAALGLPALSSLGAGPGVAILIMQNGEVLFTFRQNIESDRLAPAPLLFAPLLQVWLDSNKRRSRLRIYVEILDILKEGAMTPYEISFRLRLNQKRTREYLEFLQKNSFVDCGEKEDGKRVFEITENGKAFVENLRSVLDPNRSILDPKENSGT